MTNYQHSLKDTVAIWHNVNPEVLYALPYSIWCIVRDDYLEKQRQLQRSE